MQFYTSYRHKVYILIAAELKGQRDVIDDRNTYFLCQPLNTTQVYTRCSVYSMNHKIYGPNCKTK